MKVFFLSICMTFNFLYVQAQKQPKKITHDYLSLFESWKLIINSGSFTLTTNKLFWPDTSIIAIGTFSRTDSSLHFNCDTTKFKYETLYMGNGTNFEVIGGQSKTFSATDQIIDFKNVMRQVYDTLKFSDDLVATYYRGDGKWTCLITLLGDNTYSISESVHGNVEHSEKGLWTVRNRVVKFTPKDKKSYWLNSYGNPKSFYYTNNFLIGKKRVSRKEEVHYYFVKVPIDW